MRRSYLEIALLSLLFVTTMLDSRVYAQTIGLTTVYVDARNTFGPWLGTLSNPYENITSGLTYAREDDIVFVFNGTYHERLDITKSITLQGQDKQSTIIDANQTGDAIRIEANNVTVTGFTVQNSGLDSSGISVLLATGNRISQNIMKGNFNGIRIFESSSNTIADNNVSSNYYGISISASKGDNVTQNSVSSNMNTGIRVSDSSLITISNNSIANSPLGVVLLASNNCTITHNNASSNDSTGFYAFASDSNVFSNNKISSSPDFGIRLDQSAGNLVDNNTFLENRIGIFLGNSTISVLQSNNFIANTQFGIRTDYSDRNTISTNTFTENFGILFFFSDNNTVFHNNFHTHSKTLLSANSTNHLDNGLEGNYWIDYMKQNPNTTETDNSGLWSLPYIVDADNRDNHPLRGAFTDFTLTYEGKTRHVFTICNATITGFQFDPAPRMLTFNVTSNNTTGFCRTDISEQLINSPYTVLVNEEVANTTTLPTSEASRTLFYFTFNNTQRIRILSKSYYELLDKYNALQVSYDQLSRNSNETAKTLNTTQYYLQKLTITYDELWNNYSSLRDLYRSLNETHEKTESEYAGTRTILIYVAAATMATIIIAVTSLSLTIKYHRKSEEQAKAIVKYKSEMERISLMNSARADFEADVQRRGEKIKDFQRKYSIAIRPRATLEDTIRSLELKKKKEDEQTALD